MKKGDLVKISNSANYSGQDMRWTETKTSSVTLKKGTRLFHFSDNKINSLLEKETCFFQKDQSLGHCYVCVLKNDIEASEYSNETRIFLNSKDCEVTYVGYTENIWKGEKRVFVDNRIKREMLEANYIEA